MLSSLGALKNLIKPKSYHIDYPLFRLHYQATSSLIFAYCLILSAKILFGDVIDCRDRAEDRGKAGFFDNICYAQGTYTSYDFRIDEAISIQNSTDPRLGYFFSASIFELFKARKQNGSFSSETKYIYPGIPVYGGEMSEDKLVRRQVYRHNYYQYFTILLFLQAVFFYLPHYLWKAWEGGVISSVCKQIHEHRFKPWGTDDASMGLIYYIRNHLGKKAFLAYKYYFCQVLLLVNLVAQILVLDNLFNDKFISYGFDAFEYFTGKDLYGFRGYRTDDTAIELNNPMDHIFPKLTSCVIEVQSDQGSATNSHPFLCVLTLNVFNDKFYLVLWAWFLILMVLTLVQIIFDLIYLSIPAVQRYLFRRKFGHHLSSSKRLPEIFLLDLIGCNSDRCSFTFLVENLLDVKSPGSNKTVHSLV